MRNYLNGMKILDFTRLIPGPYATQILADLGADVIKVEAIEGGDYARLIHPQVAGVGTMFVALNRNKNSIAVNLKSEHGRKIIRRLVVSYDIVFESFRSGVMGRLGLGYEDLEKINTSLIYVSLSGFGQKGSYAARAVHDINCLALTGISSMITDKSGRPVIPGLQIADMSSGLFSVIAILAAQQKRNESGLGSYIDLTMADSTLSMMSYVTTDSQARKNSADRQIRALCGDMLCYNYYETKDGRFMSVGAVEPQFWQELCRALKLPELMGEGYSEAIEANPHFITITNTFKTKTQSEWKEVFLEFDACVEPVLNHEEVIDHPVFVERNMIRDISPAGPQRNIVIDTPIESQRDEENTYKTEVGKSSSQVLSELGFSDQEIEDMSNAGAIRIINK